MVTWRSLGIIKNTPQIITIARDIHVSSEKRKTKMCQHKRTAYLEVGWWKKLRNFCEAQAYHYIFIFAAICFHGVGFLLLDPIPVRKCFFIKFSSLLGRNSVKMCLPRIIFVLPSVFPDNLKYMESMQIFKIQWVTLLPCIHDIKSVFTTRSSSACIKVSNTWNF
jgi:hypothetical protein